MARYQTNSDKPLLGKWTLYWSPEGKPIAHGVVAPTARAAIRRAPKEYRKYPAEIYAVCENPNAYIAIIRLHSDGWLLGGTRKHVSSAFASESDAIAFAKQSIEVNKNRPEYTNADISYTIVPTISANPIPAYQESAK